MPDQRYAGVGMLRDFCAEHSITYDECGKLIVALDETERGRLSAIHRRATANGVPGGRHVTAEEAKEIEPHVRGVAGLHSPSTAIVDYAEVTRRVAEDARARGAVVRTGFEVTALRPGVREVVVSGSEDAGPNAVFALAREGYRRDVSLADLRDTVAWRGFRRFAARNWRIGVTEVYGSLSKRSFVAAARRYLRAQAVRNAPSPAATTSLAIAGPIVDIALERHPGEQDGPAWREQ